MNAHAVNVLLDNLQTIAHALEFAFRVKEDVVWSRVAKAQLREGLVSDAIESFIRADDSTHFLEVIKAAEDADVYHDLVKYLLMVRQNTKEPKVDSELIYAYAKIECLGEIEEFILMPNVANLPNVGDRLYDEALYEAAKIIFAFISNWAKLAVTLVKLKQFQGAVDAARKANSSKTWKEVCFACVDAEEFRLAQICGLNVIIQVIPFSTLYFNMWNLYLQGMIAPLLTPKITTQVLPCWKSFKYKLKDVASSKILKQVTEKLLIALSNLLVLSEYQLSVIY